MLEVSTSAKFLITALLRIVVTCSTDASDGITTVAFCNSGDFVVVCTTGVVSNACTLNTRAGCASGATIIVAATTSTKIFFVFIYFPLSLYDSLSIPIILQLDY